MVWIAHDPQVGREMKGMQPMLVISPRPFNERTGLAIGFPMSTASYNSDNPFAVAIEGPQKKVGYVLCQQPKSFDWSIRGGGKHPWGKVSPRALREALSRLDSICGICNC